MKTPIQELIEKWESEKGSYIPNGPIFQAFIDDAKSMLEKEKEVIMDAYIEASPNLEDIIKEAAVEYYNKTFKTKER